MRKQLVFISICPKNTGVMSLIGFWSYFSAVPRGFAPHGSWAYLHIKIHPQKQALISVVPQVQNREPHLSVHV